nr:trehalose-phosphatase [Pseudomonas sp. GX19020]
MVAKNRQEASPEAPPEGQGISEPPVSASPRTPSWVTENGPALPDPGKVALFLDLDGTLLDLAATPDQVAAEPGLGALLRQLERRTEGALALVTGRQVAFVDALFPAHRFTVAGLHGAELRPSTAIGTGIAAIAAPARETQSFLAAFSGMQNAARDIGLLTEDKGAAFALHYRQAPELREAAERIMAEAARIAGPLYRLREGKCVIELCPAGADKGAALRNLMASPPFNSRRPLAAGDDLTDEAMFGAANALGGITIRIGAQDSPSAATARIASPAAFRAWLRQLAGLTGAGD